MRRQEADILKGPILSTLVRFAAPLMLTSLFTTFYTLTDLVWIGRLSSDAVAAVGIIGFILWMGEAVAMIARTGLGVVVAQAYGAGEEDIAKKLGGGLWVSLTSGLLFVSLAYLVMEPFVRLYALGDVVSSLAYAYGRIVFIGAVFQIMHFAYSQAYQSLGNSKKPFAINLVGLVLNVVLDPLLIFGLGPLPALGISGAALATTLAQIAVFFLFRWDAHQTARREDPLVNPLAYIGRMRILEVPEKSLVLRIIQIGLPVSLMTAVFSLISMVLNRMVSSFGALAMAVTTIGAQVESINWMTVEGFGGALTAMTAQNIGAKNKDRVLQTMRTGIAVSTLIGLAVMAIFLLFGRPIFRLFLPKDPAGQDLGTLYLLIFSYSEVFMALETASAACYNAMGRTLPPALTSIIFNAMRIPLGLFLMARMGVQGVWLAMSLSSLCKGSLVFLLLRHLVRSEGKLDAILEKV